MTAGPGSSPDLRNDEANSPSELEFIGIGKLSPHAPALKRLLSTRASPLWRGSPASLVPLLNTSEHIFVRALASLPIRHVDLLRNCNLGTMQVESTHLAARI
jgi:hypothetical protein